MNAISDTYRSIAAPSKGIYKELGSKFLAGSVEHVERVDIEQF